VQAAPPPVADVDDVPLLTDAVEEIEAPSILDAPDDEAGADAWGETLTGSHPTEAGAPAIAAESATLPSAVESIDIAPPPPEEPAIAARAWYDPSELAMPPPPPAEELPLPAAEPEPVPAAEVVALHAYEEREVEAVQVAPAPEPELFLDMEMQPPAAPEPQTVAPAEPQTVAATDPEPQPVAARADDDARWTQLAEEVRMQVLQRIDLFTDTGLREQLAARLQPIVDRASADLVATINQHVGVLLRAYVAEAIEREIERWRDQSR
jgi:hypothetical protein